VTLTRQSATAEAEFGEFAAAQAGQLFRIAYLLCGDWHEAQDLVQVALTKLFVAWGRARRADHVGSYARSVLVNSYLSSRRLRRSGELPVAEVFEAGVTDADADLRLTLVAALRELPPQQDGRGAQVPRRPQHRVGRELPRHHTGGRQEPEHPWNRTAARVPRRTTNGEP
jgi:DNA-directed RNA polymerase specialized sigma24 family protein